MNEDQVNKGYGAIAATVGLLCEKLTDGEMAGIGMRLALGSSFEGTSFEKKISPMLDGQGGMHEITQNAFWHIYHERFPEATK